MNRIEEDKNRKYFNKIIQRRKNYFKNKTILNNKTGEIINKNFDIDYMAKKEYVWLVYNLIMLTILNKNKIAFFVTNTLISSFHPIKLFNKNYISNKKYNINNTPNMAYRILNQFKRNIYNNFVSKIDGKTIKHQIKHASVIEMHDDNTTPHSHCIFFVDIDLSDKFEQHINNQISKNKNIGQSDIQKLDNTSRASSYLTKYIQKSFKDTDYYQNYYGWRLRNNISRAFTFSKTLLTKEIFDKLTFHLSKNYAIYDDVDFWDKNYYQLISSLTNVNISTISSENELINVKNLISEYKPIFNVNIVKQKSKIINKKYLSAKTLLNCESSINLISNLKDTKLFDDFSFFIKNNFDLTIEVVKKFNKVEISIVLNYYILTIPKIQTRYKNIHFDIFKKLEDDDFTKVYTKEDFSIR
jgi:hypothetical protein